MNVFIVNHCVCLIICHQCFKYVTFIAFIDIAETSVKQAEARLKDNKVNIPAELHVADCTRVSI